MKHIFGIPVLGSLDSETGKVTMVPLARICDLCGKGGRGVVVSPAGSFHPRCLRAVRV